MTFSSTAARFLIRGLSEEVTSKVTLREYDLNHPMAGPEPRSGKEKVTPNGMLAALRTADKSGTKPSKEQKGVTIPKTAASQRCQLLAFTAQQLPECAPG